MSTPTAPAERCRRGERCSAAETVDGTEVGAESERPLCRSCTEDIASALRDARLLYVQLRQQIHAPGSTSQGERVTSSKSRPLPLNASALDLTEQLHWLTTTWSDEVITTAGRPGPDRASQTEGQQIDDACHLLGTYLTVWISHRAVELNVTRTETVTQAGWEAAALLLHWKYTARRALGIAGLTHRPPEPCPACNVPGVLERRDGDDKVRCTNCRKSWTLEMYKTFVHAWMRGAPAEPTLEFERRGPETALDGQDARAGAAAHSWTGAA